MSDVKEFLKRVDLFSGLSDEMLSKVAQLCRAKTYPTDSVIVERHESPEDFYLVRNGTVKILIRSDYGDEHMPESATITLGMGQSFGEMGLIDSGPRSATVQAATNTELYVINCELFRNLCEADTTLGYKVMRNIAADLSFKLRYRNLI